jgi:deoxycytidine triphosphate deaminase
MSEAIATRAWDGNPYTRFVVLSDATIARCLAEGRIEIDPYDDSLLQPSSVDVRVDGLFRVFHNNRYPFIDVKVEQEELTELVTVDDEHPFVLHPGEFVLGSTLERIRLPDDLVARLEGKALALDTPVPTTEGWKTMGELRPGDLVFDEDGFPTAVLAATPPMMSRPCREIVFSDGTSVVSDVDHQWRTMDKSGRQHGHRHQRVVTTGEIAETLDVRSELNHHLPPARVASDAAEIVDELELAGYAVASQRQHGPRGLTTIRGSLAESTSDGFHQFRAITDVREVDSVPVRCIQVSSPNGLFLITRSFIPTHNSSLGRLGLLIHSTAGFIDPGWDGHVTLELSNVANLPITIYPGMKIGQISFMQMTEPATTPYGASAIGSKYKGQKGPTPSRYFKNFE